MCILSQIQDAEEREREMEREAAKPFARSKDDAELDALYRERVRFGDPMAHLVKKKAGAQEALPVVPDYVRKQMKKRGFVIPVVRYAPRPTPTAPGTIEGKAGISCTRLQPPFSNTLLGLRFCAFQSI